MLLSACTARRAVAATIGAGAVTGAMLVGTIPSALADPPPPPPPAPGCSAGEFEQVTSQVSAATAAYLFEHPDVNAFFSTLKGQPKDQIRDQVKTYLAANPQTQSDLAGIRQPLHDMKNRCQ
ncbi:MULTISPECIES: heme-binding protein [unclassified Mycolicibacterium]|uniref:heme-binding protein n=1 Tax=unclassified Mycolicibacterium TaxID=2636767 RepID=UPI0012DF95F3|nr:MULTISPECIES: heme-binding protein [unclassified Mycolicibacterium]MUL84810.1 hemophore-related protein [Mycolicibacterium sp. CBMA 329]MUL88586.1 hemophore-related protein [Mycolicibacterium sp. CBMA 331]MUM00074.1 hemophore-related protein [Mycolicibacterium sp. CBMA 334]MUM29189.1 hemophore-related protein [Mycolicibacterium sp. CBMA 295]MUM40233.1 hemophore-related protein [Mycolicibacterium sp. CBMA 247]